MAICGIKVHSVLLADCTVEQIRQLRSAACNVVVHNELGSPLAKHLADRYNMPFVCNEDGAPIGFVATESWIRRRLRGPRRRSVAGRPRDRRAPKEGRRKALSLHAENRNASRVEFRRRLGRLVGLPLANWLAGYLAMTPVAMQVTNEDHPMALRLKDYLESIGVAKAWNAEMSAADAAGCRLIERRRVPSHDKPKAKDHRNQSGDAVEGCHAFHSPCRVGAKRNAVAVGTLVQRPLAANIKENRQHAETARGPVCFASDATATQEMPPRPGVG